MSSEQDFRMPAPGDEWRHYKGGYQSLYEIVSMARDEDGNAVVVYVPAGWGMFQRPPMYTRKLGDFLKEVINPASDVDRNPKVPRFTLESSRT